MRFLFCLLVLLPTPAFAGLYCSQENYADLPSQWRGFLLDQRAIRQIANAGPLRTQYLADEKNLATGGDAIADRGALLIRLGQVDRALEVLRDGAAKHPNHFAIAANLGTAWQLKGDLPAAVAALKQSVHLAPGRWLAAEELHLKLVLGRMKQKRPGEELDDLFGLPFVQKDDVDMPEADRKRLTPRLVGLTQQLALWLPNDGPLLWQLAELANATGDVRTAANLMEGCVASFGMTHPDLRRRRLLAKEAAAKLTPLEIGAKEHQPGHAGALTFRSRKPLLSALNDSSLPPIREAGVNAVPWEVFTSTAYEGKFPPKFGGYLKELDGKTVTLTGFLQPLREDAATVLLLESPVGCWYCEMPDLTGMLVLQPSDEPIAVKSGLTRVVGRLSINSRDPEDFLFTLRDAKIAPLD